MDRDISNTRQYTKNMKVWEEVQIWLFLNSLFDFSHLHVITSFFSTASKDQQQDKQA